VLAEPQAVQVAAEVPAEQEEQLLSGVIALLAAVQVAAVLMGPVVRVTPGLHLVLILLYLAEAAGRLVEEVRFGDHTT